jgi:hypothetical protein
VLLTSPAGSRPREWCSSWWLTAFADIGRAGQLCDGFQGHVAAALDGPFIVLFEQYRADEANNSVFVGEDADDLGASLDLAVDAFEQRVGAVLVSPSAFYLGRTEQLAALAARHALPAIYPFPEFVLAGGLMSYGTSLGYRYHQVGIYTGRISKARNRPISQVTKLDLAINLKTAKALGLTIPETLLAIADEVIQ